MGNRSYLFFSRDNPIYLVLDIKKSQIGWLTIAAGFSVALAADHILIPSSLASPNK